MIATYLGLVGYALAVGFICAGFSLDLPVVAICVLTLWWGTRTNREDRRP